MTEYFDGNSATAHQVSLRFEPDALVISSGAIEEIWRNRDIRYASATDRDAPPVTFRNVGAGKDRARLVLSEESLLTAMRKRCPDLNGGAQESGEKRRNTRMILATLAGFLILIGAAVHFLPGLAAPLVPVSWEEKIGREVSTDIGAFAGKIFQGSGKSCDAPAGRAALDRLRDRLAPAIDSPYRFRVTVIDIDEINAFAAPGGFIVFFKKLITEASSADEVAGVLAHEMGHVAARHPMEAVARDMGISLLFEFALGGFGGGIAGSAGQALLSTAYSRDAEREADAIGLDILARSRISSKGLSAFFQRLAREHGGAEKTLAIINTHPLSEERARAVARPDPPDVRPALSPAEWQALRNICG